MAGCGRATKGAAPVDPEKSRLPLSRLALAVSMVLAFSPICNAKSRGAHNGVGVEWAPGQRERAALGGAHAGAMCVLTAPQLHAGSADLFLGTYDRS